MGAAAARSSATALSAPVEQVQAIYDELSLKRSTRYKLQRSRSRR